MSCSERAAENTGEEDHCLHDIQPGLEFYPGKVCCWCGSVYLPDNDGPHGPYESGARGGK